VDNRGNCLTEFPQITLWIGPGNLKLVTPKRKLILMSEEPVFEGNSTETCDTKKAEKVAILAIRARWYSEMRLAGFDLKKNTEDLHNAMLDHAAAECHRRLHKSREHLKAKMDDFHNTLIDQSDQHRKLLGKLNGKYERAMTTLTLLKHRVREMEDEKASIRKQSAISQESGKT